MRREIDLRAERDDFYSDYRMKCDKETKALTVERDALRYDIERHVAICAEQAQEMDALAAQLAIAQNAEAMQRFDCRNLTEKVIPNLREQRDALAAQAKQYRAALRTVFFLDHNEMEWQSLGECQEWARLECVRIDAALAAKGKA